MYTRIPQRFSSDTFDNYEACNSDQKKNKDICSKYANDFMLNDGTSMILYGKVGTGKTHLACSIFKAIEKLGFEPIFITVVDMFNLIKTTYRRDSEHTEQEILDNLINTSLLILDEIGIQHYSDTEKLLLDRVVGGRYNINRPTLMTTNLNEKDFISVVGVRIMDRMKENGGVVLKFDWESYRGT